MANLNVAAHLDVSTYRNGPNVIEAFTRVFNLGGSLRPASAIELENGVLLKRAYPNQNASVLSLQNNQRVTMVAANAIGIGNDVFAAANGRVASTGTRKLGKAITNAFAAGDHIEVMVQIVGGEGGGGGGEVEVLLSAVELTGPAPPGYKVGYDYTNKELYFVNNAGNWEIHPSGAPAFDEDVDHDQLTPSATWTINHGRGKFPDDVTIFDSAGREAYATVSNPNVNTTVITFALPATGRANLEFQQ